MIAVIPCAARKRSVKMGGGFPYGASTLAGTFDESQTVRAFVRDDRAAPRQQARTDGITGITSAHG